MRENTETIVEFPQFGGVAASLVVEDGELVAYPVEEEPEANPAESYWRLCDDSEFSETAQKVLEDMGIEIVDATEKPSVEEEAAEIVDEMFGE